MQKYCQKCHNQKYYKGISQSKELPGSVTIERTAREYQNQKYIQKMQQSKYYKEVSQVKVQSGSATLIRTVSECHKQNASIISTYRECRDQKYNQGS